MIYHFFTVRLGLQINDRSQVYRTAIVYTHAVNEIEL